MALFLVQHGLSLSKEKDPQKGLSDDGVAQTQKIANVAKMYSIPVSKIFHSGKKRAAQTAEIFHQILEMPTPVLRMANIAPMDDVEDFSKTINPESNMMVVGHLPFMEKLVSFLTTGSTEYKLYRFQNSGIVCLDSEDGKWFIKWTLNPDIS